MRFLGLNISATTEKRGDPALNEAYWQNTVYESSAGVNVTPDTARYNSAVYACVQVISQTIASIPLFYYQRLDGNDRSKATDQPLFFLLNHHPNDWMTRFDFIESAVVNLLLRGNFYAQIVREKSGKILALVPLDPDRMLVSGGVRDDGSNEFFYKYTLPSGGTKVLSPLEILHVKNQSDDGIVGRSVIQTARDAIGLGLSLDQYASKTFKNGARLSGVLEHPAKLDEEVSKRISRSWQAAYGGSANAGATAVLEEGMSYRQMSMTNQDAEFILSRKFQIAEIARIFRIPPHMIGDLSHATFSNIEHQSIDFVVHTIRPWTVRIEQALMRQLVKPEQRDEYFIEFLLDALLRGDSQSRAEFYNKMFQIGVFSVNDIRRLENENSIGKDGDKHFVPLNMVPIDRAGEELIEVESKGTETNSSYSASLETLKKHSEKLAVAIFERILDKERLAVTRNSQTKTGKKYDEWLRTFYRSHAAHVKQNLTPVVDMCAEQIELLSTIYGVTVEKLPRSFVDDYANVYIGKRFGPIYEAGNDPEESLVKGSSRREAIELIEAIFSKMEEIKDD